MGLRLYIFEGRVHQLPQLSGNQGTRIQKVECSRCAKLQMPSWQFTTSLSEGTRTKGRRQHRRRIPERSEARCEHAQHLQRCTVIPIAMHLKTEQFLHLAPHDAGVRHHDGAGVLQCLGLCFRGAVSQRKKSPSVAHGPALGRRPACDHCDDRLGPACGSSIVFDELCRLELCLAPDLANADYTLGLVVLEEKFESVHQRRS